MPRSLFARLAFRFGDRDALIARRDFLKAGALAAAAMAGCASPRRGGRGSGSRVIVIGGGFAGLACAYELMQRGASPTVLEARKRVGGRVLSFSDVVPGRNVEGGGEFIGANHPSWLGYAERFGLEMLEATEEELEFPVVLGGRELSAAEAEELYLELEGLFAPVNEEARGIDATRPWMAANASELDLTPVSAVLERLRASAPAKAAARVLVEADGAVAAERQSYLGFLAMVKGGGVEDFWTQSESYRCKGGNQRLAVGLARALGERVRLETPVRSIDTGGSVAKVVTAAGDVFEGDAVVLAIPPSLWRDVAITPPLPEWLTPQTGVAVKNLVALSGPAWRASGRAPDALTDGDISMTWNGTDGQEGGGAALVCFSGGPAAVGLRQRSAAERQAFYGDALARLYPGIRDSIRSMRFMDWPGDPLTQVGYSFPTPGEVTAMGPTLAAGVGNLRFAGEHCSPAFVGYMEGALTSGRAAARGLLNA